MGLEDLEGTPVVASEVEWIFFVRIPPGALLKATAASKKYIVALLAKEPQLCVRLAPKVPRARQLNRSEAVCKNIHAQRQSVSGTVAVACPELARSKTERKSIPSTSPRWPRTPVCVLATTSKGDYRTRYTFNDA
ncbi:Type IV pilus assembly PilZ [Anopheles sinensis]|uniref:Type IV pilus assembly PilZ n=1 Tax=Anopheles sinensis TaxID=74873 RepID=A0A084VA47_ANOSI|nr:Type IV pilus assembly PilZ [Anopheles sinensis]